jgi:uncharacterized linocin/CFP29 family protein
MPEALAPAQRDFLLAEIVREARRTLIGRRFIGLHGPLGPGVEAVRLEHYGPDRDALIDTVGRHDPEPISPDAEAIVRVPILYKDFVLQRRDVELASQLGAPLDATRAIRAAHFVADREDALIFNGEPKLSIPGLLTVSGRNVVTRSDWGKYGAAYADVCRAMEALLAKNHHWPFALAVSPADYAVLVRQREGAYAPELDAIARLCDDGVYTSPSIPAGKAVMLSTGDQNVDIAVAEDLNLQFLGEQDQEYPHRVYECLTLRIKRPAAICTIE